MHDAWQAPTSIFAMNANLWPSFLERHYGHFFFRHFESLANVLRDLNRAFQLVCDTFYLFLDFNLYL